MKKLKIKLAEIKLRRDEMKYAVAINNGSSNKEELREMVCDDLRKLFTLNPEKAIKYCVASSERIQEALM